MNRRIGLALGTVALSAALASSAFGQYSELYGERYGLGVEGTIGRGTAGYGPKTPFDRGDLAAVAADRGVAPAVVTRPYLTTRYYEPGDGYRYSLYYDPASRGYFYYPVRRRPTALASRRPGR